MTRKKKTKTNQTAAVKRELVLTFGTYKITGEDERFYYCGSTQFFKNNRNIVEVRETPAETERQEDKPAVDADAASDT